MSLLAHFPLNEEQFGNIRITGVGFGVINKDSISTKSETMTVALSAPSYSVHGDSLYIFGGNSGTSVRSNAIYKYNMQTGVYSTMNSVLPFAMGTMASETVGDKIYIFGGVTSSTTWLNSILEFDPIADTLTIKTSTLPVNIGSMSSAVHNNKIYLFGGRTATTTYSATIYEYNPSNDTLSTKTSTLPATRAESTASSGQNGLIYIFGGQNSSVSNTIYEYNPATDSILTKFSTIPVAGASYSSTYFKNGKIYITTGFPTSSAIYEYDYLSDNITSRQSTISPSRYSSAIGTLGDKIYILGGYTTNYSNQILEFTPPPLTGQFEQTLEFSGPDVANSTHPLLTSPTTGVNISRIYTGAGGVNEVQKITTDGTYNKGNIIIVGPVSTETIVIGMTMTQIQSVIEKAYGVRTILTVEDVSGNNLVGTLMGDSMPVPSALHIPDIIPANNIRLDGVNDYIYLDDTLNITGSALSICCWVRKNNLSSALQSTILSRDNGTNRQYSFVLFNGQIGLKISGIVNTGFGVYSNSVINDNMWHHIAVTWDGSDTRFFVDGIYISSSNMTTTIPNVSGATTTVGRELKVNSPASELKDLRVYNHVLTDEEVMTDYQSVIPVYGYVTPEFTVNNSTIEESSTSIIEFPIIRTDIGAPLRSPIGQLSP